MWYKAAVRNAFAVPALAVVFVCMAAIPGAAQVSKLPRTREGKPNLQGIWQALNTAAWDLQDHSARLGVPAGHGVVEGNDIPYQPWALARRRENAANAATADPDAKGYLPGVPRIMYMPYPFQVFQTPDYVAMTFEYARGRRIIYTNSTTHVEHTISQWLGDSRARWEGDTLVVDAVEFTDETWLDHAGNFHSDALHLVERYTLTGPDHMNYEVTIEDPKVFTRPWKIRMRLCRRKETNLRLLEYEPGLLMVEEGKKEVGRK